MSYVKSPELPSEGRWEPKILQNKLAKEDGLFNEILVEDIDSIEHIDDNDSIDVDTTTMETNSKAPIASVSDQTGVCKDGPHNISPDLVKVRRVKRSMSQHLMLTARSLASIILSAPMLLYFVTIATYRTAKTHILDTYYYKKKRAQDKEEKILNQKELLTQDEVYYANLWGYTSEKHEVVTEDGYILIMYRILKKGTNPQGKRPVLIGHGLFQCSGAFVLNEERSLAFVLIDEGYDVWVGNNRSTAGLGHTSLSYKDPEYWNWGLKELGIYDFPALIDHVRLYSGFPKVAYIGHSQGNAQVFVGLSLLPELSDKLSCFVALAPAVFAGNLINTFPLTLLINLSDWMFSLMFGVGQFLPAMSVAQKYVEPNLFCFLAYSMFSYLFTWWDSHWLRRRKAKYFQYTPRPVSSKLIADWIAGWGRKGVCMYIGDENVNHNQKKSTYQVPLTIFYGTADYLVNGERLVRTFKGFEAHGLSRTQLAKESSNHEDSTTSSNTKTLFPMLNLVHVERIEDYEHMDTIWGYDNHTTTYPILLKNLKTASWD